MLPLMALVSLAADPFLDVARDIERGISAQNAAALDSRLHVEALIERSVRDIDAPKDFKQGFIQGATRATFGAQLSKQIAEGGRFKLLRLKTTGGKKRALYRLIAADGAVSYYELSLARSEAGIVADDIYPLASGERFSETARRTFATAAAQANQGILDRLLGKERDLFLHADKVRKLTERVQAQRWKEAMEVYEALPPSLQKERICLLMRLTAASKLEPADYEAAFDAFQAAFPGDPAADLFAIDAHFHRKQWAEALAAIDRLDRVVKDPYLNVMRAGVLIEQGKLVEARAVAQAGIAAEPDLPDLYWAQVNVALKKKDHAETARLLGVIERDLGIGIADLTTLPEYAAFVESPQYQKWLRSRK